MIEKEIDELRQILLQKGAEKGTRILLEQINKEFIGSLTSLNVNLKETIGILKGIAQESKIDKKEILEAVSNIKLEPNISVTSPKIEIPKIEIPQIEIPKFTIPTPQVTVNPPDIHIPEIKIPNEIKVTGFISFVQALFAILKGQLNVVLGNINQQNPLPVILTDENGVFYKALLSIAGMAGGGGGGFKVVAVEDKSGSTINPAKEDGNLAYLSPSDSIGDGTETVSSAGTAVQLSTQSCRKVFIQAHESNTGTIVVGSSTVVAALIGRRGKALFATQGDWFYVNNINLLYIDSTQSNDKVNYYWEN